MTGQSRARQTWRDINGIVLLDKPVGLSSNQALQRVRRLYQARKAGHAGSLDPFATGQLPICFGESTKVCTFLLDSSKRYLADAWFGITTTTGDPDGETLQERPVADALDSERLSAEMRKLTGQIQQVPPMYSALHHNGQRLYDLARQGKVVDRPARDVTIFGFELVARTPPDRASFRVHCSKGTYIRTLIEDLGAFLGCGAHLTALRRLQVDPFPQEMITLDALEAMTMGERERILLPSRSGLAHLDDICLDATEASYICNGRSVEVSALPGVKRILGPDDALLGVGVCGDDGVLKIRRGIAD